MPEVKTCKCMFAKFTMLKFGNPFKIMIIQFWSFESSSLMITTCTWSNGSWSRSFVLPSGLAEVWGQYLPPCLTQHTSPENKTMTKYDSSGPSPYLQNSAFDIRYPFQYRGGISLLQQHHQGDHIDSSAQDCSNSSALAMELLQSYTKSSASSCDPLTSTMTFLYC